MEEEKKTCFIMMPISDVEGYEKGHFSRIYDYLIKPACDTAGFQPVRADDTSKANFIVIDILKQILECDMAICDLSSRNPNVFYELGIRQACNKKTILIKDFRTQMPFDIAGIRTINYNENLRIDEVKKSIPEIVKCIKETEGANKNEVNSLIQLLAIEPASIPQKIELSQDSNIILNAIRDLDKRVNVITEIQKKSTEYIQLPNGEIVKVGTTLYDNKAEIVGVLQGDSNNSLFLRGENDNKLFAVYKDDELGQSLSEYPF